MITNQNTITVGEDTITYAVRRSARRRKTVQISVVDGAVIVAAPMRTSAREIENIVRARAAWILRLLAEEARKPTPIRFVTGEKLPYRGRNVPLIIALSHADKTIVRFIRQQFHVSVSGELDDTERADAVRDALITWYKDRAADHLLRMVTLWWPRLGQGEMSQVLIRNQKRRWGSCSADGTLRFNWRVMMLEPALAEYIVVHELAHLTQPNHSRDFWNHMSAALPNAQDRRKKLREAGKFLPF